MWLWRERERELYFKNHLRKNKARSESGITLIALVITIIVLIILAGISISMISGNEGILARAGESKDATGLAKAQEAADLAFIAAIDTDGKVSTSKLIESLSKDYGYTLLANDSEIKGIRVEPSSVILVAGGTAEVDVIKEINSNATNYFIEIDGKMHAATLKDNGLKISEDVVIGTGSSTTLEVSSNSEKITAEKNASETKITISASSDASESATITVKYGEIDTETINVSIGTNAVENDDYLGYYADVDGDGTPDGIIFADLAVGKDETKWNSDSWAIYSYDAVENLDELKDYTVSSETYTGFNGQYSKNIVTATTEEGKDRFYVMALEDVNLTDADTTKSKTLFTWYDAAYGKLDNIVEDEKNDFELYGEGIVTGRKNTVDMLNEWNKGENGKYGAQNDNSSYDDMWGVIQKTKKTVNGKNIDFVESTKNDEGEIKDVKWFVPSKSEWAAFGDMAYTKMSLTTGNYEDYKLYWYWCSSQRSADYAFGAYFDSGYVSSYYVNYGSYVRLAATF